LGGKGGHKKRGTGRTKGVFLFSPPEKKKGKINSTGYLLDEKEMGGRGVVEERGEGAVGDLCVTMKEKNRGGETDSGRCEGN